jgi:hypothetical protein
VGQILMTPTYFRSVLSCGRAPGVAQTYEKQGDRDKAHAALWQASDYLATKAPAPGETDPQVLNWHTLARYVEPCS